jgi:multicomponent Na+:H+ antiporter subunit D
VRAGTTYVVVSLLSSVIFLSAIGLVYGATGTLNLAHLAERVQDLPPGLSLALEGMLLLAFGIKAAVFPLSAWLPDSYPTAPAPVTAVFAGLLTKVGVYAIIRTKTLLFPDSPVGDMLMFLALLTMVVGILGAVAQSDIKRLLSFTLISHIGYMLFGVGLASVAGLTGAIFYVVHHIVIQTTLFLVAGLIERRGGTTSLDRLGGLSRVSPLLAVLFFVPALNLAGIPPFSGFLGKLGLLQAGVEVGSPMAWTLVAGGVVTSLLTLYAIARVWNLAFWRMPHPEMPSVPDVSPAAERARLLGLSDPSPSGAMLPRLMIVPTLVLVALGAGLTLVAGPLFDVSDQAARDLLQRTPYLEAVFPREAP